MLASFQHERFKMTNDTQTTPTPDPATELKQITVEIPADRVEAFERFVARFQRAGERPGRRCGGHRGGPRGRGRHIHVHLHG